jgi:Flp pilus assembly pilin Flp
MNLLKSFWREDRGQDVVEYTLLMAAMALATAAVIIPMKNEVSAIWTATNTALNSAAAGT